MLGEETMDFFWSVSDVENEGNCNEGVNVCMLVCASDFIYEILRVYWR